MADDLLSGRVTSFRREQGFGVITLDDGRDIKFDASACTMVPEEGAAVQLRIGPARWGGGFKALHVEPRGSSTLFVPAAPPSLDQQIAALQREHLAGALSEHVMAQLVTEVFGGQLGDASLIDVNAYHQPGVEAGKKAAARVIDLQGRVLTALAAAKGDEFDAERLAAKVGAPDDVETVHLLLERLAVDSARHVRRSEGSEGPVGKTHPGAKFRSM
jgi:cold shock CspA family protein